MIRTFYFVAAVLAVGLSGCGAAESDAVSARIDNTQAAVAELRIDGETGPFESAFEPGETVTLAVAITEGFDPEGVVNAAPAVSREVVVASFYRVDGQPAGGGVTTMARSGGSPADPEAESAGDEMPDDAYRGTITFPSEPGHYRLEVAYADLAVVDADGQTQSRTVAAVPVRVGDAVAE